MSGKSERLEGEGASSCILIVEDDIDQMNLLAGFAVDEIKKLLDDQSIDAEQKKEKIKNIKVLKVTNIESLQKTVSKHKEVLLAILDCNLPDTEGGKAHDQFVKSRYTITGQHKAVDIVTEYLPDTPVTLISASNRFRNTVNRYYQNEHDLSINFINKADQPKIKRNIRHFLRQYLS